MLVRGVLVASCLAVASAGQGRSSQPVAPPTPVTQSTLEALFVSYSGGDYDVVDRELRALGPFAIDQRTLDSLAKAWREDWRPVRATFFMELALAAASRPPELTQAILTAGANYVLQRPTPLGANPEEDAYKTLWHETALSLLEARRLSASEEIYVRALDKRYARRAEAEHDRFELQVAIDHSLVCCTQARLQSLEDWGRPTNLSDVVQAYGEDASGHSAPAVAPAPASRGGGPGAPTRAELQDAIGRFDRARDYPNVRFEASVRGAFLLLQAGDASRALQWLDRAGGPSADDNVNYWAAIVRGRVLDALARSADAVSAYRHALEIRPNAKSAGIRLSIDLARLGRRDEAGSVAEAVTRDPYAEDPWLAYDRPSPLNLAAIVKLRDQLRKANK